MTAPYTVRRATAADAEALARGAAEGVSGYGEFAPGWSGPGLEHELADARALLPDPEYHAFVAEGQARARRFYEREGWRAVAEPYDDPVPGLSMVSIAARSVDPANIRGENRAMGRLDADDGELAARFRSLDEASRRRVACSIVRLALRECEPPVSLPHTAEQLLGIGGVATPAQLADLDRRAASSGGMRTDDALIRRHRAVQAARYALSPQPRAPEEALYEAIHASASPPVAIEEARRRVH